LVLALSVSAEFLPQISLELHSSAPSLDLGFFGAQTQVALRSTLGFYVFSAVGALSMRFSR